MKRHRYRIYPINIPPDLRERIALIHAAAIIRGGNKNDLIQFPVNNKSHASRQLKGH